MFAALLFAQATIASIGAADQPPPGVQLFNEACLDGQVSSDEYGLEAVEYNDLPRQAYGRFHRVRSLVTVLRTDGDAQQFLVFFERENPTSRQARRGCAVVVQGATLLPSYYWLTNHFGAQVSPLEYREELRFEDFTLRSTSQNPFFEVRGTEMVDHTTIIQISFFDQA